MVTEPFSKIKDRRQDGAIYGGYLFSFDHLGKCTVYKMKALEKCKDGEAVFFSEFSLDKSDLIKPHSNSVMFSNEFFDKKDKFPLLYTNIYNNYSDSENKKYGVCLVYRLIREQRIFKSVLVQIIEIGFTEDKTLWKSEGEKEDVRPYGNFAIDAEKGILYAYTMRDNAKTTRYFCFNLPKVNSGKMSSEYNVKKVILNQKDISGYFDCDYHHFIQGACCYKGKIYSLEGIGNDFDNPPAIRIIDTESKKEISFERFADFGINTEPELICIENDICYYSDHHGNVYKLFL